MHNSACSKIYKSSKSSLSSAAVNLIDEFTSPSVNLAGSQRSAKTDIHISAYHKVATDLGSVA